VPTASWTWPWVFSAGGGEATDHALYRDLRDQGLSIAADICCFFNPHLNHLTPNCLDIDELQRRFADFLAGGSFSGEAEMKDHIEGPPRRQVPILLRQTAYKALTESVSFDGGVQEYHTARFGEIEQRGVALTPAGRALYDAALDRMEEARAAGSSLDLESLYRDLPDDLEELRRRGLVHVEYHAAVHPPEDRQAANLEQCLAEGLVAFRALRYEDFLPVSAAGIFASNLGESGARQPSRSPHSQAQLEDILGCSILSADALYAAREARSLLKVHREFQLPLADEERRRLEALAAAEAG
jgi:uncharacterized glyoxalase superfamily metalloenzyme YdcJ